MLVKLLVRYLYQGVSWETESKLISNTELLRAVSTIAQTPSPKITFYCSSDHIKYGHVHGEWRDHDYKYKPHPINGKEQEEAPAPMKLGFTNLFLPPFELGSFTTVGKL